MTRSIFSFALVFTALSSFSQNHNNQAFADSMASRREAVHRKNMIVLGSWAGANLIGSGIAMGNSSGARHYFHQMNVYWNIANLGIAAMGLLARSRATGANSWSRVVKQQHRIETIVAVNGGLDLGYIMTGIYLKERGQNRGNEQLKGYGNSLLLQGGFLLAFDIFQYIGHRRNGRALENALGNWQLGATSSGLGMVYRLK